MAEREFPDEHPFWDEHVSKCSPCYREFLAFRHHVLARQSRNRRNASLATEAVIALVVGAGSIYVLRRQPQISHLATANQVGPSQPNQPLTVPSQAGSQSPILSAVFNLE